MATNIIMHQKSNMTAETINTSFVRLKKLRVQMIQAGHNEVSFFCLKDRACQTGGLLDWITPILYDADPLITDESYYQLTVLADHPQLAIDHCKNILWNPALIPLDLCQTAILANLPSKGDIKNIPDSVELDAATLVTIKENALPFIEMPMKWWDFEDDDDIDTEFKGQWYFAFVSEELKDIKTTFMADITNTIDTYSAIGGVQGFIESQYKGVVLPTKCGQFTPYYINNEEKNLELNEQWETKIRHYFPTEWYPPDQSEMDAPLFSYDHEWRDVSKQVRFLFMDDNNGEHDQKSDLYARLWFL
jgi:hypothetical protein